MCISLRRVVPDPLSFLSQRGKAAAEGRQSHRSGLESFQESVRCKVPKQHATLREVLEGLHDPRVPMCVAYVKSIQCNSHSSWTCELIDESCFDVPDESGEPDGSASVLPSRDDRSGSSSSSSSSSALQQSKGSAAAPAKQLLCTDPFGSMSIVGWLEPRFVASSRAASLRPGCALLLRGCAMTAAFDGKEPRRTRRVLLVGEDSVQHIFTGKEFKPLQMQRRWEALVEEEKEKENSGDWGNMDEKEEENDDDDDDDDDDKEKDDDNEEEGARRRVKRAKQMAARAAADEDIFVEGDGAVGYFEGCGLMNTPSSAPEVNSGLTGSTLNTPDFRRGEERRVAEEERGRRARAPERIENADVPAIPLARQAVAPGPPTTATNALQDNVRLSAVAGTAAGSLSGKLLQDDVDDDFFSND